ncbi:MAG: macro domain-containing protein [Planctomycetota bacterium]
MKILLGDILKSKAQTLVNTVNCVGIMGKGIALEFKNRFPEMFKDYAQRCERNEVRIGRPYVYKSLFGPQIVNFPTKDHWKSVSKVNDIEQGLDYLLAHYKEWGVTSVAIPPLGCGNGQLEWKVVGPLIYSRAKQLDIPVEIYAPYGTNPAELTESFLKNASESAYADNSISRQGRLSFNPAWVGLIEILYRIEKQPYHWPVGRIFFQKIAYVATQQGLPTGFNYQRKSYGPFSQELKLAESKLINNNLLQEERVGRMFEVKVGPGFEESRRRYKALLEKYTSVIEKTTDLFMRVDTKQAETLATVIFTAVELKKKKKAVVSEINVLDAVMEWKQCRKPPLDKVMLASTIRNLGMLDWLDVKPDDRLPVSEENEICV